MSIIIIVKITLIKYKIGYDAGVSYYNIEPGMKMSRDIYDHTYGMPLSEVYHWYVQRLYKYGMYVCGDREFVLDAITQLFVHVRSQGEPLVNRATLRFAI